MNTIVTSLPSQSCSVCGDNIGADFAHYDMDIKGVVCMECHMRLNIAHDFLRKARMRKCIQVSNGKPLRDVG